MRSAFFLILIILLLLRIRATPGLMNAEHGVQGQTEGLDAEEDGVAIGK
jgi:hypothetical protein